MRIGSFWCIGSGKGLAKPNKRISPCVQKFVQTVSWRPCSQPFKFLNASLRCGRGFPLWSPRPPKTEIRAEVFVYDRPSPLAISGRCELLKLLDRGESQWKDSFGRKEKEHHRIGRSPDIFVSMRISNSLTMTHRPLFTPQIQSIIGISR